MAFPINRRDALLAASSISIIGLFSSARAANLVSQPIGIKELSDKIAYDMLKDSPESATSYAINPDLIGGTYKSKVSDRSLFAEQKRNNMVKNWIKLLEEYPDKNLSESDALTKKIALSAAKYSNAAAQFNYGDAGYGSPNPYIVSQLTGAYIGFPDFLASQHEIKDNSDAESWLSRLSGFAKQLKDENSRMNLYAKNGIIPPKFIIETTLKQLKEFIKTKAEDNVLVKTLAEKASAAKLDSKYYSDKAKFILQNAILPSYNALIQSMNILLKYANNNAGVWKLPRGQEYYKTAIAYWTTTNKSPDEVHNMGKKLVIELQREMDIGLKSLGFTEGTVAQRMGKLSEDKRYTYPNTDEGKAKLLSDINDMVKAIYKKLPLAFDTLPKAGLEVKRVPQYTEAGAPGGYYQQPAPDGSRSGAYYINLRDTSAWPKWSLPTLTYHEGVPGHHNQIALAQEAMDLPFLRSKMLWFGAYGEGWALYSESLADELGMYENDPAGRLGYLQSMAFRAARCVVDTGIHAKKWSKQKAIDYMHEATGDTIDSIATEVERYCVWPGQATCYMVGRIKIMELREKAKKALGEKFDIKKFHNKVLLEGAMPLDVLEEVIDKWIAQS